MIDAANATNIAITGRLRAAGLLAVAERVAKREELLLHHVIAIGGDPTGGHVALWRALAAEGKDAAALAAILGWPAAVIERHVERPKPRLVPPPAPPVKLVAPLPAPVPVASVAPPAPRKSEPRAVKPRAPRPEVNVRAIVEAAVRAAVEPLREEIGNLRSLLFASESERELRDYGAAGEVVRAAAKKHGVLASHVTNGKHANALVSRARQEIIVTLTTAPEFRWPRERIALLLHLDRRTMRFYLQKAGIAPLPERRRQERLATVQHLLKGAA